MQIFQIMSMTEMSALVFIRHWKLSDYHGNIFIGDKSCTSLCN